MERLTERRNGVKVIPLRNAICGTDMPYWKITTAGDLTQYISGAAADRLASYEDTGLEPEEINEALREKRERESGRAQPENEPLTNAQRIRGMSDEELAEFLILSPEMEFEVCLYCKNGNPVPDDRGICLRPRGVCFANDRCEAFKDWLQQPAETEGTE